MAAPALGKAVRVLGERHSSCPRSSSYQQIENYVLQPTIIGKAAKVSGFTVLASVLVFRALFGFIGAIIGVPIAAGLQIVGDEITATRRARIAAAEVAEP